MKYTKSVKHHVSMGNYEWVEFGAEIEIEDDVVDFKQAALALEVLVADEVAEARLNTDEKKSYIHIYKKKEG